MAESRNPYVTGSEPILRRSVIAFVDILGYMDLTRQSEAAGRHAELLLKLHNALKKARAQVDPKKDEDILRELRGKDLSAFRAFTDNIVIGRPLVDDGEGELGAVFYELSFFQMIMTMEGFFVRGAVAIGDVFIDDIAVFGSGLIEAFDAERMLARDPRIVLAATARNAVNVHLGYYGHGRLAPQVSELLKDSDGQYFVNYLGTLIAENGHFYRKELLRHKAAIEEKLEKYRDRPPIWSKYVWAASYHNYFCGLHSEIDLECRIDAKKFLSSPRLIVE